MIYDRVGLDAMDAHDISCLRDALPPMRRTRVDRLRLERDRRSSIVAWSLLQRAVTSEYGLDLAVEKIVIGEYGKPSFEDHPDVHFNISHTRGGAMCVVDRDSVGCDIQAIGDVPHRDPLLECRVMSQDERRLAALLDETSYQRAFCAIWVLKEALTKRLGTGLTVDVTTYDFSQDVGAYLDQVCQGPRGVAASPGGLDPYRFEAMGTSFALYERDGLMMASCSSDRIDRREVP